MTEMPERIYVRNCNKVNGCLPVSDEPSSIFVEKKYIRADRYESLQAMAEKQDQQIKRLVSIIASMRDAIRTGNIDSPEIGDASTNNHKWHEEWEHLANQALTEHAAEKEGE